ncbi:MAG: XRE family transcriptional regulator [Actinomycetota bacterium]|nr:XRE family transcriptional regulator [Actinomycetota bacterium]
MHGGEMSIGSRIAEARRARGMTQSDLAEVIAKDASAVSRLERGERRVSSYELGLIADELGVSMNRILGIESAPTSMALAARVQEAVTSDEAKTALADVRYMLDVEAILDQIGIEDVERRSVALVVEDQDPVEAGRRMAAEARRHAQLGDGPLGPDLEGIIENHFGVDVMLLALPERFLGTCVLAGERAVIAARESDRYGRRRFTLAHELGHHLFGDPDEIFIEDRQRMFNSDDLGEKRANAFAANFLAPAEWLARHVSGRQIDASVALEVSLEAGMSYLSTVYHLHNSGLLKGWEQRDALLDENPSRVAYQMGRFQDWDRAQRGFGEKRGAGLVAKRALRAYRAGAIGVRPLADVMLKDDPEQLRSALDAQNLGPAL